MKPKFYKKRVEAEIKGSFPDARIVAYERFSKGLVSPTYKVWIDSPKRTLVVKVYKPDNYFNIKKNEEVIKYLRINRFPVPEIFSNKLFDKQGIFVMGFIEGENAMVEYNRASKKIKQKILFNAGKILKKLHSLKGIKSWEHRSHNNKDSKEWIKWTEKRVKKYLDFFKKNVDRKYYLFFSKELKGFLKILKSNSDFVPLHWDYHLANILVSKEGKVKGLLDFDQTMRGHSLADLGIAKHFLRFESADYENFDYLLKGYGVTKETQRKLIEGYFFLHLMAITRSLYHKKKYSWIIKRHYKMFEEIMNGYRI